MKGSKKKKKSSRYCTFCKTVTKSDSKGYCLQCGTNRIYKDDFKDSQGRVIGAYPSSYCSDDYWWD